MTMQARSSVWIASGILAAGVLLFVGAVTTGNSTLVVVTFLLVAVSLQAAGRGRRR